MSGGVAGCCCSDGFLGPFHLKVKEGGGRQHIFVVAFYNQGVPFT